MRRIDSPKRCLRSGAAFAVTLVLALLVLGCPTEPAPAAAVAGSGSSGATTVVDEAAAPASSKSMPSEAGPAALAADGGAAKIKARYEKELPLEGSVRFTLASGCRGCTGGELSAKASREGSEIVLTGEMIGCEGLCPTYHPATTKVTVKGLPRKLYTVRSALSVLEVEPLRMSASKRTEWVLHLLGQDCTTGIEALRGSEEATKVLADEVGRCLNAVPPEVRLEALSSMLTWDDSKAFVPALIESLGDAKVGYLAARVLGRTKDGRAVGPLIEALASEEESLRWDAARSLKIITEQDFGEDQARWKAWRAARR